MIDTHITRVTLDDGSEIYAGYESGWYITNKQHNQWLCRDGKPRHHAEVCHMTHQANDDPARFDTLDAAIECYESAIAAREKYLAHNAPVSRKNAQ